MALNNLAWVYQQQGHNAKAQGLARQAYVLSPSPQTADTLGWILTTSGNAQSGVTLLRQASGNGASDPRIQYHYAVALKDIGNKEEAKKQLKTSSRTSRSSRKRPRHRRCWTTWRKAPDPEAPVDRPFAMPPIRLLTFSTLFPHAASPNHGIFVENRLRHLLASKEATSIVLAPVPWFPSQSDRFGTWALHARAPAIESRHGIEIRHPRFPVIPRFGMSLAPWLLYRAMVPQVAGLLAEGHAFDAIDAHYLYPDGVAATWLGQRFGLPVVITARGTDINLIPQFQVPRRLIQRAIRDADALIAVSAALKQALVELGAPAEKVAVLRNGVETDLFRPPLNRAAVRAALGLKGPTLISVGGLIERKGHHRTIEAMRQLPGFELIIAGEGPERVRLAALIATYRPGRPACGCWDLARIGCCLSFTAPPTRPFWPHRGRVGQTSCWS